MKSRFLIVLMLVMVLTVTTLASTPVEINASEQVKISKLFPHPNFFDRNRNAVMYKENQVIDSTKFKGSLLPLEFFFKYNNILFERFGSKYFVIKPSMSPVATKPNASTGEGSTATIPEGVELANGRLADFKFSEDSISTPEKKAKFIAKYGIGGKSVAEKIPSVWNTHGKQLSLGVTVKFLPDGSFKENVPEYDEITWTNEMFSLYYKNPPILTDKNGQTPPYHLAKHDFFAWLEQADPVLKRTYWLSSGIPGSNDYYVGNEVFRMRTIDLWDPDYNPRVRYEIDATLTIESSVSPSYAVFLNTVSKYYFPVESEAKEFYELVLNFSLKQQMKYSSNPKGLPWRNDNIEFMKAYKIGEREVIFLNILQGGSIQVEISDKGYDFSKLRTSDDYSYTPKQVNYPNLNGEGR